jgi:hypothetical protein
MTSVSRLGQAVVAIVATNGIAIGTSSQNSHIAVIVPSPGSLTMNA